jgi:hypothetical protein
MEAGPGSWGRCVAGSRCRVVVAVMEERLEVVGEAG